MDYKIQPVKMGITNCYVVQGEGTILIDTGFLGNVSDFTHQLERIGINPRDISLIIITHGHVDHISHAKELKEITGAKIVMHNLEKEILEKGLKVNPPGVTAWGRFLIKGLGMLTPRLIIEPASVDIQIGESTFSLAPYGIDGEVIFTPGHSPGSISVLLGSGEVFAGDMAMNMLPMRRTPGLPIFAVDIQQVQESWKILLDKGAKTVFPAHGNCFPAEIMRKEIRV